MHKKAWWFSRHEPTAEQLAEIEALGFELVVNKASYTLGNVPIEDNGDVIAVTQGILAQCDSIGAQDVFGVFPTPIQAVAFNVVEDAITMEGDLPAQRVMLYSAWNVKRSTDGGKPTFSHKRFLGVGILAAAGLKWFRATR